MKPLTERLKNGLDRLTIAYNTDEHTSAATTASAVG